MTGVPEEQERQAVENAKLMLVAQLAQYKRESVSELDDSKGPNFDISAKPDTETQTGRPMRPFNVGGTMIQRIVVISTMKKPVMVRAVFKDGDLLLEDRKRLPPTRKAMLSALSKDIPKMVRAGFKVLVEEISGDIAQHIGAVRIRLSDKHHDGRPVIVVTVERYHELKSQGSLIYPPKGKSLYDISPSLLDVEFNPAGEPVYRIDWTSLTPEHVLMLLVVYSTVFNNVGSEAYINAMHSTGVDNAFSPLTALFNLVGAYDRQVEKDTVSSTLTGTRIDKQTVIL